MATVRPSFPNNYKVVDNQGVLTPQWNYFFRSLTNQLPDPSLIAIQTPTGSIDLSLLRPILDPVYVNVTGDSMSGGLSVPSITINGTTISSFPLSTTIGGTGLTSIGTINQILGVNTSGSNLEYKTISGSIGIGISNLPNSITISNTGVTSLIAGSGISISGSTGSVTISSLYSGTVTSVSATVPSFLSISGSPITSSGTLAIGYSGTALPVLNGGTGLTSIGTANQILGVNTGGTANEYKTISGSTGLSVTPSAGNISLTNTGVTSLIAGTNISLSGSTGAVTISSTGGGSVSGSGQVSLYLGGFPGGNESSYTVTGQTSILSTAKCFAKINGDSTSATYTANDHRYLAGLLNLSCSQPTAGSGFTIYSTSFEKLSGYVIFLRIKNGFRHIYSWHYFWCWC
jgi:hypothetical protein